MLEKWKQWAIKMNLRKAAIIFIIIGFVLYHLPIAVTVVKNWMKRNNKEFSVDTVDNDLYVFYKEK